MNDKPCVKICTPAATQSNHLSPHKLLCIAFLACCLSACMVNYGSTPSQRSTQPSTGEPLDQSPHDKQASNEISLICHNAERFAGQQVGDGHCVSLIKLCTNAPTTSQWRSGQKVVGQTLTPGTIIATFKNGRYPSRQGYHAAIYIRQDEHGIWVWDQWKGKAVHQRLIRHRRDKTTASNSANAYRVVKLR